MGISNLLPFLENSRRKCHVSEFRGHTVAVDSYCWLHKGAISCALELAKGNDSTQYVSYCLTYVKMLLSYNIKPIMVFDGKRLPAKLKTEQKRRESRRQAHKLGVEQLRLGKTDEAYKFFRQSIDIKPEMALNLIKECRKIGVDCIVAPYESDAQLAFLHLRGIAEAVITEDSDLLLFGCKKVLYKMDNSGSGELVESEKINDSMKLREYSFDKFRHMCILSGCDYVESLPGIGIKKALKFVAMTAEINPDVFLDKIPGYLNMRRLTVTEEYKKNFMIADATFLHQTVFDPINRELVPLNPITDTKPEYCENAGDIFDNDEALELAFGNLDPSTMKRIDNWHPSDGGNFLSEYSIWASCFKLRPLKKPQTSQSQPQTPKRCSLDVKALQEEKFEHERQVEIEIECYKTVPKQELRETTPVREMEKGKSPEVSPVITSNPFVKKRLSRFSITNIDRSKIVKSRFFSPKTQETTEIACESEIEVVEEISITEMTKKRKTEDCEETQPSVDEVIVDVDYDVPQGEHNANAIALISVENIDKPVDKKRRGESSLQKYLRKPKKTLGKQRTIHDMFRRMNST